MSALPDDLAFGPYLVRGLLGEGAVGVVYEVVHRVRPDKTLALKWLKVPGERHRRRFRREIAVLRLLQHPNIIHLVDDGEDERGLWYAMEHLGRVSLRDLIACNGPGVPNEVPALVEAIAERRIFPLPLERQRRLSQAAAIDLLIAIAEAVAESHACGIVHRDLKPENVMVRPGGQPVLFDFGLAAGGAEASDIERLTATGLSVGTLAYMAPEQHRRFGPGDERSDVFALGQILVELLTGVPTNDQGLPGVQPPPQHLSGLPRPLRLICQRATADQPSDRYHGPLALSADLQRFRAGEPVLARLAPWPLRMLQVAARTPRRLILTALLLALVVFGGLAGLGAGLWVGETWRPLVGFTLQDPVALSAFRPVQQPWTVDGQGMGPPVHVSGPSAVVLQRALPATLRISLRCSRPSHGELAIAFGSEASHWRLRLGVADGRVAVIERAGVVVGLAPFRWPEGGSVAVSFCVFDGDVEATVGPHTIRPVVPVLALPAGPLRLESGPGGRFQSLSIDALALPGQEPNASQLEAFVGRSLAPGAPPALRAAALRALADRALAPGPKPVALPALELAEVELLAAQPGIQAAAVLNARLASTDSPSLRAWAFLRNPSDPTMLLSVYRAGGPSERQAIVLAVGSALATSQDQAALRAFVDAAVHLDELPPPLRLWLTSVLSTSGAGPAEVGDLPP